MQVVKKIHFHMGHRVPNHKSKCKNVHGHTYVLEVHMEGSVVDQKGVSEEGMVIDFSDIKRLTNEFVSNYLDHGYMGNIHHDKELFTLLGKLKLKFLAVDFIPTAENIAAWLYTQLVPYFTDVYGNNLRLAKIVLWETPTSYVEYVPPITDTPKNIMKITPILSNEDNICLCSDKDTEKGCGGAGCKS